MAIYNGTPGNDTLNGSAGSVDDTLNAGLGNDLYRYALGSGNDVITDTGGLDTLQVGDPNNLYSRWTVYRVGNDLVFDFDAQGRVTIADQFVAEPIVEALRFDDGGGPFAIANSPLGTPGNDLLIGGAAAENIDGGAGDDIIFANEGDDTISGGDGDDEIHAGPGANVIDGGDGDDSLSYSFAPGGVTVNLSGITQQIPLHGALLDGHVLLSDGLTENIVSGIEEVEGSAFADVFFGGSAEFLTFSGRAGDDWFHGGTDANSSMLVGYWDAPARVIVNLSGAGINVGGTPVASMTAVDGQGGTDHFVLGAGHVEVSGSRFNDYLRGSDTGNVGLWGGAGNDTIVGGAGLDAAGFHADDSSTYGAIVNLSAASLTVSAAVGVTGVTGAVTVAANQARDADGNTDTLISIENAVGSEFNDYLLGSGGSNLLSGNEGNDTLDGGAGSDNLAGDEGNDFLQGGAGSDTLDAGSGVDVADGGTDSDTLVVRGNFAAYLRSRPTTTDTRLFNAVTGEDITFRNVESVNFQDGNKSLAEVQSGVGIGNNDSLVGTSGDDTLDGLTGVDTLVGLEGNDTYVVDVAADMITENLNEGIDRVDVKFAVGGTYTLANHVENGAIVNATVSVNLIGNALNNDLQGNGQANTLSGLDGNDGLSGLAGNDSLIGGTGNDTLDGGAGVDTLVGGVGNDTYVVDVATDVITESLNEGIDWVNVLLPAAATYILVGNVENAWIGNATAGLNLTGNGLNNTLQGNGQANILSGLDGNDGLYGGAGNDTLLGGAGSDFLAGGGGNDSIDGGVIVDRINYTDGNTVSYASANAAVSVNLSGITGSGTTGTGTASDGLGGIDTLANIFYVQGSAQNDTLIGSAALTLEVFEGGAGDDSIDGGAITDTLNNENANRVSYQNASGPVTVTLTFSGGTLAGSATGADGNDTLFNINQVRGSSHNDSLTGSDNTELVEHFEGRDGDDTIDGAGGLDLVRYDAAAAGVNVDLGVGSASDGDGGTDELHNIEGARGSRYADTLTGGNAASDALEFFMGLGGNDTIDGGSGYDRAEYHLSTAGVNVTLGGAVNGSATGDASVGTDTLISIEGVRGSAFNDTLTGSDAVDIFESFEGREGNDQIDGKGGVDRVDYQNSKGGVTVTLANAGAGGTASDGYGGTDTLKNIENVRGSRDFNDNLVGNDSDNLLEGLGGNDTLSGGLGNDSLLGGLGNDTLIGGTGDDTLQGNEGNDLYLVDSALDVVTEMAGQGLDRVDTALASYTLSDDVENLTYTGASPFSGTGNADNNSLVGAAGNDSLSGLAGDDTLIGLAGNDTLNGGAGNDSLVGGLGDDVYLVTEADDVVDEVAVGGVDRVETALGSYTLGAGVEHLTYTGALQFSGTGNAVNNSLVGAAGDDTLIGNAGNDTLIGNAGNDRLFGGAGDDLLAGGDGIDTLQGGSGDDAYEVDSLSDVVIESDGEGYDSVTVALAASGTYTLTDNVEEAWLSTPTAGVNLVGNARDNFLAGSEEANNLAGLTGDDLLLGGGGDDTLDGGFGDDYLYGDTGNDNLQGGAGSDELDGGAGNDTLDGGLGNDSLIGGAGDDVYVLDVLADVVTESATAGTDRVELALSAGGTYTLTVNVEHAAIVNAAPGVNLVGNAADNALTGNVAANSLSGFAGNDTLDGVAGDDRLDGGTGDDSLLGGLGNDTLIGGAGNDTLQGNEGNDLYVVDSGGDVVAELAGQGLDRVETALASYTLSDDVEKLTYTGASPFSGTGNAVNNSLVGAAGNDTLSGEAGDDTLIGNAGNDRLIGGAGDDSLSGLAGNDTLIGNDGSDTLDGGQGNDSLVGGLGDDLYMVGEPGDVVIEYENEGYDSVTVALAGPGTYTLTANVEEAWLSATAGVNLVGNASDNFLAGNGAANNIAGLMGDDLLLGGGGNDTLDGGFDNDYLYGETGNDSLLGGDGNDELDGGDGGDTLDGGLGDDTLLGNTGNDSLRGGGGNDYLQGGDGADTLDGGLGDDELYGDAGNDSLLASDGNDYLEGGDGNDTLDGGLGDDELYGDAGNDSMRGSAGSDELDGGDGTDTLDGGLGDDTLYGDTGNDTLLAGDGDDSLDAGTGVDLADGGAGSDTLVVLGAFADYSITRVNETDTRVLNTTVGANEAIVLRGIEFIQFTDVRKTRSEYWNNVIDHVSNDWTGTAGDDSANGLAGNDTLSGLAGNDTLIGGTGADVLIGGAGDDTYEIDVAGDLIVEQNAEGTDQVNINFAATGSYTLVAEFEHATVTAAAAIAVHVTGNELNNRLTGNAAANILRGGDGNDTLNGGAGSDTLVGGSGDDEYQIDVASDVVSEAVNEGNDLVNIAFTSTGSYTLTANVEDALVTSPGDSFAVQVTGNALANALTGHAGANNLIGLDGNDTLDGGGGNDTLDGGIGSDTAILAGVLNDYAISRPSTTQTRFTHLPSGNTILISNVESVSFAGDASTQTLAELIARIGSPGNDTLSGTGGDDTLAGVLGNDSLTGGAGNDDLQGGDGIDTLSGGAGNDLLDGGAGNDTYQFAIGGGDDIIDQNDTLAGSIDTIELASPIGDLISGETTLTRGWHSYDDLVITVNSGSVGAEVVDHLIANDFFTNDLINLGTIDQIRFLSNSSALTQTQILAELLKGTGGDDWLRGYANTSDSIAGGAGNDTLGGAAGNDTLSGGLGNDSLSGDAGADLLDGGAGADQVFGGDGNDTLSGSGGNDTLSGDAGNDTYVFGPGFGQDVIQDFGAVGEVDTLKFNVGIRPVDVAVARAGNDLVVSFTGAPGDGVRISDFFDDAFSDLGFNRQIEQFAFADGSIWSATAIRAKVLVPTSGDDEITGYLGSESLSGLAGDDTIAGGAGNDTLTGGDGTDRLTGGSGVDRFVFDTADALVHADLITDFVSGVDRIALKGSVFTGLGAVGATVGLSAHLTYDSGTGALAYDADGVGGAAAVTFATLGGAATHPATLGMDFLIV